jgi:hypothetical protein
VIPNIKKGKKMNDPTENIRRELVAAINSGIIEPEGQEWTTDELTKDFEVISFFAPFVSVKHKATGKKGSLMFRDQPRVYFSFREQ